MTEQLGFGIKVDLERPEVANKVTAPVKSASTASTNARQSTRAWEADEAKRAATATLDADDRLDAQNSLWVAEPPPLIRRTLAETLDVPATGLRAIGSFSGCGGSSLGLKSAGIEVLTVIEFVDEAADTYELNQPGTFVDRRDIRQIEPEELLERHGLQRGELDLFEGSPPCASFTPAGKRAKLWGQEKRYSSAKTKQRTDDLFWEWARLLDGLNPRAFIAENVPGMLMGPALETYARRVVEELAGSGDRYRVQARVLNAASYGVPQQRQRLIFVGLRSDVDARWEWPAATTDPPHTLRQVLELDLSDDPDHLVEEAMLGGQNIARYRHLQEVRLRRRTKGQVGMYGDFVDDREVTCTRCEKRMSEHTPVRLSQGGLMKEGLCADGQPAVFPKNGFQFMIPDPDEPAPTIIAHGWTPTGASICHPSELRKLTLAEVKTCCGFPSDFRTTGKLPQRYERYGRAVPPPLYRVLGQHLAKTLRGET